jgi:hypothetical protein
MDRTASRVEEEAQIRRGELQELKEVQKNGHDSLRS